MANGDVKAFPEIGRVAATRRGAKQEGLRNVQEFLNRFGYVRSMAAVEANALDDPTAFALANYQRFNQLPVTGEFDEATREHMTIPRCGHADLRQGVAFVTQCAWDKCGLRFAFDTGTNDIGGTGEFQAIRNAFQTWGSVVNVTFTEVGVNDNPDVRIGWRPAADPDHDMTGGVLAHADFPPGCSVITNTLPKPLHFDDEEHTWAIGAVASAFDVETVALHEIGHILGLAHSSVAGAVMAPTVASNFTKRNLTADDISGVQSLYPNCGSVFTLIPVSSFIFTPLPSLLTPFPSILTPIDPITPVTPITPIDPIDPIGPLEG